MLVKAKWNVKDAAGWHSAGEVFNTESDLGNAVEVLDAPKPEKVKEVVKEEPASETKPEPVKKEASVRTASTRRKNVSK